MTRKPVNLVVLISGGGSNLQALIDKIHLAGVANIATVISNKADAGGLQRATKANIETQTIQHQDFKDRNAFDQQLVREIDKFDPDYVLLAGFMRILSEEFIIHYKNRILNIHPSLLPKHKGLHTHQQAIKAGDKEHGATVHLVVPELDSGTIIAQAKVPVLADDDTDKLAARVLEKEHKLYPEVVRWLANGWVRFSEGGSVIFEREWGEI
jgi:phosphoribosylglycinamide formyltransferase 1